MSDVWTAADSIRPYLTGATSDGAHQADHALSVAGYRSCVEAQTLTPIRFNPIGGIAIAYVSAENGTGLGVLYADTTGSLKWTASGDTEGASVDIAHGETKQIPSGTVSKYLVVTRTSAADLSGTETLQTLDTFNTVAGGADFEQADSTAGATGLRDVVFYNGSGASITGLTVWIDSSHTGHTRISSDGVTWVTPSSEGAGLSLGTVAAGASVRLHLEQSVTAGASANARIASLVRYSFTASAVRYTGQLRGLHRVAAASTACYLLYHGADAYPDLNAAPAATSATLPFTFALSAGHTHYVAVAERNQHGLISPVESFEEYVIAVGGANSGARPSEPVSVVGSASTDGAVKLSATYWPTQDGDNRATQWLVYATSNGVDPVPGVDTPTVVTMRQDGNTEHLEHTTATALDGTPWKWLVRTRRTAVKSVPGIVRSSTTARAYCANHGLTTGDSVTIAGASQSAYNGTFSVTVIDPFTFTYTVAGSPATPATGTITATVGTSVDSSNTTIGITYANHDGPPRPVGNVAYGRASGAQLAPSTLSPVTTYINQGANVRWVQGPGYTQLWKDTTLVWNLKYNSVGTAANGLYTTFNITNSTLSGVASAVAEYVAGPPALIHLSVNGTRLLKADITNARLYVGAFDQITAPEVSRQSAPAWAKYAVTCLQVWDPGVQDWVSVGSLETDGTLRLAVPILQKGTQAECL